MAAIVITAMQALARSIRAGFMQELQEENDARRQAPTNEKSASLSDE
jgi:hypothetical protein